MEASFKYFDFVGQVLYSSKQAFCDNARFSSLLMLAYLFFVSVLF